MEELFCLCASSDHATRTRAVSEAVTRLARDGVGRPPDLAPAFRRVHASSAGEASSVAARLIAGLHLEQEYIASRKVARAFLWGFASSLDDVIAFARARSGGNNAFDRWTRQEVLRAAAEIGRAPIGDVLDRVSPFFRVSSRDLTTAAISGGGHIGWESARSDPASRSLLAAAFGDPRVSVEFHDGAGREAVYDQVWMGMRVRDMGIIDDEDLWDFYARCEKARQGPLEERDSSVRAWLVDMGSRRVSNALREACVLLAREREARG